MQASPHPLQIRGNTACGGANHGSTPAFLPSQKSILPSASTQFAEEPPKVVPQKVVAQYSIFEDTPSDTYFIPHRMKKLLPLLLSATAVLTHSAMAQNATTRPVGVVSFQLDANRKAAISIPLEQEPIFTGTVTGVSATQITDSSASFGNVAGSNYCQIISGNASGRNFGISSNTGTVLTLRTGGGNFLLPVDSSSSNTINVAVGDKYRIVPMFTLGGIFGSNSADCVLKYGRNPNNADVITIYVDGRLFAYYNNGTNWKNAGNAGDSANYNNLGIIPTSGIWVTRRAGGAPAALEFLGSVPDIAPKIQVPGGVKVVRSLPAPTGTTLGKLGFANISNWTKHNDPNNADQVTVYRPDNTLSRYFLNSAGLWKNAGTAGDANDYTNVVLPPGCGLWISRKGNSTGSSTMVQTALTYTLNN